MNLSDMQKRQPWTVPYSASFRCAVVWTPHLYGTHAVLHAQKSLGKLAAVFEALDHRLGEISSDERATVAAMSADLVTAAMRLANLYDFDLEDVLTKRVVEKNGVGFEEKPS